MKVYYLSTCDTCTRILAEVDKSNLSSLQDIKTAPITLEQLEEMRSLTDSYESLFSKRARKYKELDLKNKNLSEEDYKNYILQEYTFLKRPVFINENNIFVGNSKKTVEAVKEELNK